MASTSSDNRKLIVIVGVTGKQGGSVARVFHDLEPSYRIRGLTRDATKPSLEPLRALGFELVSADINSAHTLTDAFRSANVIFGMTDFWQFPADPATTALAAEKGVPLNEACALREIEQGKNIVDAAATEFERDGSKLERFVLSTLSDSRKWSKGEITENWHFEGKAKIAEYVGTRYAAGLGTVTSYIQLGLYMDVWKEAPIFSPAKQPDGNYTFARRPSAPNPKPSPWVNASVDTGHYVRALVTSPSAPPGTTVLGTSTECSLEDLCKLWTRVMHERGLIPAEKSLTLEGTIGIDEWVEAADKSPFTREIAESVLYSTKYGFDGGDPQVKRPAEVGVEMERLMSLEEYIREEDWSKIL